VVVVVVIAAGGAVVAAAAEFAAAEDELKLVVRADTYDPRRLAVVFTGDDVYTLGEGKMALLIQLLPLLSCCASLLPNREDLTGEDHCGACGGAAAKGAAADHCVENVENDDADEVEDIEASSNITTVGIVQASLLRFRLLLWLL